MKSSAFVPLHHVNLPLTQMVLKVAAL